MCVSIQGHFMMTKSSKIRYQVSVLSTSGPLVLIVDPNHTLWVLVAKQIYLKYHQKFSYENFQFILLKILCIVYCLGKFS